MPVAVVLNLLTAQPYVDVVHSTSHGSSLTCEFTDNTLHSSVHERLDEFPQIAPLLVSLNKGRPSATTSNIRLSKSAPGRRSRSLTMVLSHTRAPASRQTRAVSNGWSLRPRTPCNSTRRAMMATSIEWTATSALTCGEGGGRCKR